MIKYENGQYCVYSHDGSKKMGCYASEGEAQKRLKQIEYFKNVKSSEGINMGIDREALANKAILMVAAKINPKAEVRNRGNVVFPAASKKVKDKKDHFPINNENQARNALARVAQYSSVPPWYEGSLEELQKAVQSAVKGKYPGIEVSKSKGDVSVKAPPDNPTKVPGIERPKLDGSNDAAKVYAVLAELTPDQHKAFASALVKQLQMQQSQLSEAITLAEKLLDEGITQEEFAALSNWTQYDVLVQLMGS